MPREARRLRERGRVNVDLRGVSAAQTIGDTQQLAFATRNLLDNAERHADTLVTMTLAEIDGRVRLTISDDGAGISADDRQHVFERFTRLDDARSPDARGTGLGLTIVRDIVQRHGGSIDIADRLPTTFVVDLPAAPLQPTSLQAGVRTGFVSFPKTRDEETSMRRKTLIALDAGVITITPRRSQRDRRQCRRR